MIWALLALSVATVIGFGVALAVRSRAEFTAQNEVVPGHRSPAPASWAGAHTPEARLHRRLGEAVRAGRADPQLVGLGLGDRLAAIEAEALAIDTRLVAAAALPARHRSEAVDALEPLVAGVEDAVAALVKGVSVAESKELLAAAVSEADLRLRALAEARAEVERIDRGEQGTASSGTAP